MRHELEQSSVALSEQERVALVASIDRQIAEIDARKAALDDRLDDPE